MINIIQHSLKNGISGAFSHVNPLEAIANLDLNIARKRLDEVSHSIWEILYHIVFWQDIFIENIKENNPKWDDEKSWLTEKHMQKDENFEQLKERFEEGIEEIGKLIDTVDLEKKLSFWENEPILQFIVVAITHNSYHIGQIMVIKKILNSQTK